MKKHLLAAATIIAVTLSAFAGNDIDFKTAVSGAFYAEQLYGVYPMADGESFARISPDRKKITRYSFKTGEEIGTICDLSKARGAELRGLDGYIMSPDEKRILIQTNTQHIYRHSKKAEYYIYSTDNNTLEPLSKNGPQQEPLFSPDGNMVAFVRDNNLFLVKLLYNNSESQLTDDGKFNNVLNGIPDWVYEEEFSFSRAFDFSADSKMIAWVRFDESRVPLYEMQMFKGLAPEHKENADYPHDYSYKYPIAGQPNSKVKVLTYDIKSHATRQMDLPLDSDGYIPRIKFTDTPDQLAIVTLNRHQSDMKIYMGNVRSTVCKLILNEKEERYVKEEAYQQLRFIGDNFVLQSDRSGSRQLYWYSTTGQLIKQITNQPCEVGNLYGYDPKSQTFYYSAKDGNPTRTAIFATDLKGKTRKLSTETGTNSATFSATMKYFINVYSNITTPNITTLRDNNGKVLKTLIDNKRLKERVATYNMPQKELFTFKTADGIELYGWMMKPADFDPSKKYPVIMHQYSGPGSQSVNDSWGAGSNGAGGSYEAYLCSQGIICVTVDGRGTGGRGADFEKCTYLHLGQLESHDQVETAIWLGSLPYVDKDNIAIWGWSFGGFNTLMSMSEGRAVFKCGVAIAPPTSWRYYDTVYTERYMRTPQENTGYEDDCIARIPKLSGKLLICHGLADDNVHVRNTYEYIEGLVQADKQFEMQLYTNRNHSIYGGNTRLHLFKRVTDFFLSNLK
ncbi:MAG: S9 family peptidase [Prevotellaceae bacterium]|nr:S9 family peptidase [Prevotellaceae bacterium]